MMAASHIIVYRPVRVGPRACRLLWQLHINSTEEVVRPLESERPDPT